MMEQATYSVPETAKIFSVTPALIYRMIKEEKIPKINLNRRIAVPGWWVRQRLAEPKR